MCGALACPALVQHEIILMEVPWLLKGVGGTGLLCLHQSFCILDHIYLLSKLGWLTLSLAAYSYIGLTSPVKTLQGLDTQKPFIDFN